MSLANVARSVERQEVQLSTIKRGVYGVEEAIDAMAGMTRGQQINMLRRLPYITGASQAQAIAYDTRRHRPYTHRTDDTHASLITTTIGNDEPHVTRLRRVLGNERDTDESRL